MVKAFDGDDREALPSMRELIKGGFTEFVAMTLFVYVGCGAAASNVAKDAQGEWDPASTLIISLTFGLAITTLAFMTAHSSGGHINCAVTLCLTVVGKCHPARAVVYLVSQLLGSIVGAALLYVTTSTGTQTTTGYYMDRTGGLGANGLQSPSVTVGGAFVAEMMMTLLLCIVVLETAVNGKAVTTEGESMVGGNKQNLAPLPIGFAVFLAHVVLVPITGCSINPTRSFGPSLVAGSWDNHWLWWAGPCTGALVASALWLIMKLLEEPASKTKHESVSA
jgi:MIP family channel proteins